MKRFIPFFTVGLVAIMAAPAYAQLPDTMYQSAKKIQYVVQVKDTLTSPRLTNLTDLYDKAPGIFTFRGSSRRDMPQSGRLQGSPTTIKREWTFLTKVNTTETKYGTWGGGSGWTGQPVYVEWPDSLIERQRRESKALTEDFSKREIIVGSLSGDVYFINFDNGKASRRAHKSGNPIKGSVSLDPRLNGNLYIGQGIPATQPFGAEVFNLFSHKRLSFFGMDNNAWRRWGAYDPSAVVVDNFVIRPSENGTIYKLLATENSVKMHSLMRYRNGGLAPGIESSPVVWKNYLFVNDNRGNILCVNIETMKPVWHYDNRDDSDATMIVAEEQGRVVLYGGTAVDKQGDRGFCRFVKLDALTGALIWERKIECRKINFAGELREGGLFSTPLIGRGDCSNLIFTNICGMTSSSAGTFVAIDRNSGNIVYKTSLKFYSWTSPVALYTPNNKMYIFTGDVLGNLYLIEASSGKIIYTMRGGNNFESSPVVIGNSVVVGSRGREIHKFTIQ